MISLMDDARLLSPAETAQKLAELTADGATEADYYGNGGAVAALEQRFARLLGKERAVMFPTGTLANLCAMRALAGPCRARVLVHPDSHFFNDAGDNLSALGGYTMVPVTAEGAGFTAGAVRAEIARTASARVASRVGCIAIESPSRRREGRRFGAHHISAIATLAQDEGIPLFLDGARMLIECAVTGQNPAEMARPFQMVYTSLYKYLEAPFGCILAGLAAQLDQIFHERRAFGGGLWQMWPAAVLALDKLSRFDALWRGILPHADAVCARLARGPVRVTQFDDGTNALRLTFPRVPDSTQAFAGKAAHLGLKPAPLKGAKMTIKFNESWLSQGPEDIAERIEELAR